MPQSQSEPLLAHVVYFALKEPTAESIQKLVDSCHQYLTGHPGTVFFGAGTLNPHLDRPVNVRDFHVGLHIVFENQAAHDQYQTSQRHVQFVEENKPSWAHVRVFDCDVPQVVYIR